MNCFHCNRQQKELFVCSKCRLVHYCSKKCQLKDFKLHARVCRVGIPIKRLTLNEGYQPNSDALEFIHGPISMFNFRYADAEWFIFGDQHTLVQRLPRDDFSNVTIRDGELQFTTPEEPRIWDIGRLLFSMFTRIKNTDSKADFYLEMPLLVKKEFKYEVDLNRNYINKLYQIFQDCFYAGLNPQFSDCIFSPQVLFNYIDARQIMVDEKASAITPGIFVYKLLELENESVNSILLKYRVFKKLHKMYEILLTKDRVYDRFDVMWRELLEELDTLEILKSDVQRVKDYMLNLPKQGSKIKKQLEKLPDDLKSLLIEFFMNRWRMPTGAEFEAMKLKSSAYAGLQMKVINNESLLMDMYGIARALYQKSALKVVYVGHDHAALWVEFMLYLGARNVRQLGPNANPNNPDFYFKFLRLDDYLAERILHFVEV